MKKQILLALAGLSFGTAFAQPTLTNIENYEIGMKAAYHVVDSTAVIDDTTGANVTWDFSNLPVTVDTIGFRVVHPDSTIFKATHPDMSYAIMGTDGSISVMKEVNNSNQLLALITNTALTMNYTNPYTSIRRPFTYQDTLRDTAAHYYTAGPETYTGTGITQTVADGWGTLELPLQTYSNVLRVSYSQRYFDTGSMSGTITELTILTKSWYDAAHISPLLTVDSIIVSNPFFADTFASVTILKSESIPTSIKSFGSLPASQLYYADNNLVLAGE